MSTSLRISRTFVAGALVGASVLLTGCGPSAKDAVKTGTAPGGSKDPSRWPADDRSMCDWRNKPDLQIAETIGPGAVKPNVRRVFRIMGERDSQHKTLACREIDTNLDGIKDVVRTFNQNGEALHEEADRDFDGRIDVWIDFVAGRLAEVHLDTNHDGKPDVWKYYGDGQLQRIRRDRDFDGRADIWEIYAKGRLERIGMDENADGHVDRWDRDEQLKYESEAAERAGREELAAAEADAGARTASPAAKSAPKK